MPTSVVAVRSIALTLLCCGAAEAFAQSANVMAFNPYGGAGMQGGAVSMPYAGGAGAPGGMAFNPWRPYFEGASAPAPAGPSGYGGDFRAGSNLPAPPRSIESRLIAVPQRGDPPGTPRTPRTVVSTAAPSTPTGTPTPLISGTPAPPPPAAPAIATTAVPPPLTPPPTAAPPPPQPAAVEPPPLPPPPTVAAPPPPTVAAPPPPPTPPTRQAAVAPPAPEPVTPPAPRGAPAATVLFGNQSAEISAAGRTELDRIIKTMSGSRQIELRAYARGTDPNDARKVSLARALAVRSYLIDQGLKARIEVGAFTTEGTGGAERVEVFAPN